MRATRMMVVAAVATAGLFASTGAAQAAGGTGGNGFRASACSGNLVGQYPLKRANGVAHPTARVKVYYSNAGTGSNCAVLLDNTSGSHYMRINIGARPEVPVNWAADYGTFTTYAGAVGIRSTRGDCVHVDGLIRDNGHQYSFTRWGWCG